MQIQRCPECGMRLKTNYCDVCMRRVPFKGMPAKTTFQRADASSAHREENHECISFDTPKAKIKRPITTVRTQKSRQNVKPQKAAVAGIVIAVMSVVSSLFGLISEVTEAAPEPEYNYEAYVVSEEIPQITPTQLYNDGGIVVTADSAGLYYDDYTISLTIQNDSEQDVTVNSQLMSVNGFMVTCGFAADVEAGQIHQELLQLYSYELEEMGITEISEVAFYLNLYDSKEYVDIATTELLTLRTDIAEDFVQPVDDSGWELYADGQVRILLRDMEVSSYGDCEMDMYIENLSGNTVSVSTGVIQINGQETPGYLWNTLRPDTRTLDSIYLYELEELEITALSQVEEITLELQIEYMDDWYVEQTITEAITFSPEALWPYMD